MRAIFLNCWYGQIGKVFTDFIKRCRLNTDIFCFQEVSPQLFSELGEKLPQHQGIYATENKVEALGFVYGEAIFVKSDFQILASGKINLYRQVINDVGYLQFARIEVGEKELSLGNVHGKARPGTKLDTPTRLRQSKKIIDYFSRYDGPKIIGGDFNLLPETRSIRMFEETGWRNLIKDIGIKYTRNQLAWDQFPDEEKQYFADYVFTSPDVKVKNLDAPNVAISDHLPLILDFEI